MSEFTKSLVKDIVIAGLLAGAVMVFIRPTIVKQTSMQDTLNPNDYIIMYKMAYAGDREPERGDIVIFESSLTDERGDDKLLIKRVIGLSGDTISIRDGKVYVNNELFEEDYLKDGITPGSLNNVKVPKGRFFVMGDNRVVSVDSRNDEVGFVAETAIKGKAVVRLFPFNKITTL